MNRASRKWLITALILGGLSLLVLFATFRYQNDRISKINFIILDNQQKNVASLSGEEFTRYVEQCGGSLDCSTAPWTARYDGIFQHREWTFVFANPRVEVSR
jgi:hypothetical protein